MPRLRFDTIDTDVDVDTQRRFTNLLRVCFLMRYIVRPRQRRPLATSGFVCAVSPRTSLVLIAEDLWFGVYS